PQSRVVKTSPVGVKPQVIAIEADGRYAYVAHTGGDDVSVIDIDPASPTYHKTLPGPIHPIRVGDAPKDVAVSAFGPTILVINEGSQTVSIIDANSGAGTFDRVTASVSVGSGGRNITVSPDGTLLYLTLHDLNITQVFHILRGAAGGGGSGIAPGEPTSLGPPETIDVGDGPAGLAIMPDGSAALVANEVSGTVSLLHA